MIAQLEKEQARLRFFERRSDRSPDAVIGEKSRVETLLAGLVQQRTLVQSDPGAAPSRQPERVLEPERIEEGAETLVAQPRPEPAAPPQSRSDLGQPVYVPSGTPIHAVHAGAVLFAGEFRGLGNTVILDHEGDLCTVYAYMGQIAVRTGETVGPGGYLGSAGVIKRERREGIRFEVRKGGELAPIRAALGISEADVARLLGGQADGGKGNGAPRANLPRLLNLPIRP